MARLQNPESQRRYAGYMKRFVCYCLRVVAVSDGDAGSRSSRQGGRIDSDADESDDEQQSGENNQDPMRDARELFPGMGTRDISLKTCFASSDLDTTRKRRSAR